MCVGGLEGGGRGRDGSEDEGGCGGSSHGFSLPSFISLTGSKSSPTSLATGAFREEGRGEREGGGEANQLMVERMSLQKLITSVLNRFLRFGRRLMSQSLPISSTQSFHLALRLSLILFIHYSTLLCFTPSPLCTSLLHPTTSIPPHLPPFTPLHSPLQPSPSSFSPTLSP